MFLSFHSLHSKVILNLHTTLKLRGGELVSDFLWLIVSKNFYLKNKGPLRQEYFNSFYDNFCHRLHKGVFSDQDWLNLVRKALKRKVKAIKIFDAKINQFLFLKKFLAFSFWCKNKWKIFYFCLLSFTKFLFVQYGI